VCTARYGRYVPVRQDTGTRTALYRAVRLVSPVSIDTEIYRAVTVEISTVTARHSSVTVDFDRYRPAQLGNGRFRPLPTGNSTPTVPLGTPVPYRTEQLSVHRYGTVLRTL
ncbi:unnamed protein product, partial [Musa textilis]